jgi:hypothetical protein
MLSSTERVHDRALNILLFSLQELAGVRIEMQFLLGFMACDELINRKIAVNRGLILYEQDLSSKEALRLVREAIANYEDFFVKTFPIGEIAHERAEKEVLKYIHELKKRKDRVKVNDRARIAEEKLRRSHESLQEYLMHVRQDIENALVQYREVEKKKISAILADEKLVEFVQENAPYEQAFWGISEKIRNEGSLRKDFFSDPFALINSDRRLYLDKFYQFLVRQDREINELSLVWETGERSMQKTISWPPRGSFAWQKIFIQEGGLFKAQADFLQVGIMPVYDKENASFLLLVQGLEEGTLFIYDQEKLLFSAYFQSPLPRQLGVFSNLSFFQTHEKKDFLELMPSEEQQGFTYQTQEYPQLQAFVESLGNDPLRIFQYVYNEIELVDLLMQSKDDILVGGPLCRNVMSTFYDKKGSAREQCQLLVELLRQAGHFCTYTEGLCSCPPSSIEKLLAIGLPGREQVKLFYPWVILQQQEKKIALFPWMKMMQITEGQDLYNVMPGSYNRAELWVQRYLANDPNIFQHVGPDGDDTAESSRKRALFSGCWAASPNCETKIFLLG